MQATDDGCFILMGDRYDSSGFVASLQKVTDSVAPVAGAMGLLSMDFSSAKDAVLVGYDVAENVRALLQEGKVVGIQLGSSGGTVTSLTPDELRQYRQAREDGKPLSLDIQRLLALLDDPGPPPTATPTAEKTPTPVPTPTAVPTGSSSETEPAGTAAFAGKYYAAGRMSPTEVGDPPDFHYEDIVFTFSPDGTMTREKLPVLGRYEYHIEHYVVVEVDGRTGYMDEYGNLHEYIETGGGYLYFISPDTNTITQILQPVG